MCLTYCGRKVISWHFSLTLCYSLCSYDAPPEEDAVILSFGLHVFVVVLVHLILFQHVSSLPALSYVFPWYVNPSFHMCVPSVMHSRCLALPPRSVWMILPRAVPWCSALTLWIILLSEPGSLSVCVPPAARPQSLPIAQAPNLPLSPAEASAQTIAPENASHSFMVQYRLNQHNLSQASTRLCRAPLQPIPIPFQLSETPESPSLDLASMFPDTSPM